MIKIEKLYAGYRQNEVIKDATLHIPQKGLSVLLGPNGAGKSTLIYAIMGYIKARSGKVFIDNKELADYSRADLAKLIAYIPQEQKSEFDYSVMDTVLMGRYPFMKLMQKHTDEDFDAAERVLARLNLTHLKDRWLNQLSGGEKQRVYIARALIQETPFIFLDESLSQLDINYQVEIMKLLKDIVLEQGKGILLISHNLNLSANYADRMILIKEGRIHSAGSPQETMKPAILSEVFDIPLRMITNPISKIQNILYP